MTAQHNKWMILSLLAALFVTLSAIGVVAYRGLKSGESAQVETPPASASGASETAAASLSDEAANKAEAAALRRAAVENIKNSEWDAASIKLARAIELGGDDPDLVALLQMALERRPMTGAERSALAKKESK